MEDERQPRKLNNVMLMLMLMIPMLMLMLQDNDEEVDLMHPATCLQPT